MTTKHGTIGKATSRISRRNLSKSAKCERGMWKLSYANSIWKGGLKIILSPYKNESEVGTEAGLLWVLWKSTTRELIVIWFWLISFLPFSNMKWHIKILYLPSILNSQWDLKHLLWKWKQFKTHNSFHLSILPWGIWFSVFQMSLFKKKFFSQVYYRLLIEVDSLITV